MNQTVANDDLVQFTQHCLQSVGLNPTDANTDSCPGGQRSSAAVRTGEDGSRMNTASNAWACLLIVIIPLQFRLINSCPSSRNHSLLVN